MKKTNILPLICLATALLPAVAFAAQPPSKVLLAQAATLPNAQKIAQVKAGTLKTAHASWWGFDKADATDCLQNAINSGVPKLIVDNTGSDWTINKPIHLTSNQQIIFTDGVVIQAKRNAFKGKKDALFNGEGVTNVSLIGQGKVTFSMHREDYANPKLYEKAEWRHGIAFWDSSNIILRSITVTKTGGDGLYLGAKGNGYNKNVLVEDMVFDANYRQGISVISAEDLTIRNSKIINTIGTNPQAGIDFEPNGKSQRLVNITVDNCQITGNAGSGIEIATFNLSSTSKPISITVANSLVKGNVRGVTANPYNLPASGPVTGKVTISGCTFVHNVLLLADPVVGGIKYLLKDCTMDFRKIEGMKASWQDSPVVLINQDLLEGRPMGDITFDNFSVVTDSEIDPVTIAYERGTRISNSIIGDIYIEQDGQKSTYDLPALIKSKQEEFLKLDNLKLASIDLNSLHKPANATAREGNNKFYLRNELTFLQFAEKGESITIKITAKKIRSRETTVDLMGPDGKKIETYTIPINNKPFPITFTAAETGVYRVERDQKFSQYVDITSTNSGNGLLVDKPVDFLPTSGKLYFQVPAGVKDFSVGISSGSAADVALLDPNGKEVVRHKNLNSLQLFSGSRSDDSQSEIWSIEVKSAVWAITVSMYEPLIPVVSTNPATMLVIK